MEADMKTAFELFQEIPHRTRLTTGSKNLDVLIEGVTLGQSYLFYSEVSEVLDLLVHHVLINGLLPADKGGFSSKVLYFNVCNYHKGKTLLDPSYLSLTSKMVGLDPKFVFKNIYVVSAFNEMQQATATSKIISFLLRTEEVKLMVVHNLTRFVETSKNAFKARQILKKSISKLQQVICEKNIALIVSCGANKSNQSHHPQPKGGSFLYQKANVIVYLTTVNPRNPASVKGTLMKHPYKKTPQSCILSMTQSGNGLKSLVLPSFRNNFQKIIATLRHNNTFQNAPLHRQYRTALDLLLKDAWLAEMVALLNSNLPHLLDALNLMANVHNKKRVEELRTRILETFSKNNWKTRV